MQVERFASFERARRFSLRSFFVAGADRNRKQKDNAEALRDAETRGGIRKAEQRRRVFTTEFAEGTEKGESVKSRRDHSAALRMI